MSSKNNFQNKETTYNVVSLFCFFITQLTIKCSRNEAENARALDRLSEENFFISRLSSKSLGLLGRQSHHENQGWFFQQAV
jgi:hypothetical protein